MFFNFSKIHLKKTLWFLFMDGVHLSQGCTATSRRQFIFYHSVPRTYRYSFNWPRKDKRLSQVFLTPGLEIQIIIHQERPDTRRREKFSLNLYFHNLLWCLKKVLWTFKKTQRSVKIKIQVYFHFNTTFWNAIGGERFLLKDFLWEHLNT